MHAVDGVDLEVYPGETLGLVGETGCGKSTLARVIVKLLRSHQGPVVFEGQDYTNFSRRKMRPLRREMQMMFQDPYASLNPRKTVGSIIADPFRIHQTVPRKGIKKEVQGLMELVGLNPEHYNRYPHEFSGGQRQRIGVARALALQAQADRVRRAGLRPRRLDPGPGPQPADGPPEAANLTYIFIAHDLSVVRHV